MAARKGLSRRVKNEGRRVVKRYSQKDRPSNCRSLPGVGNIVGGGETGTSRSPPFPLLHIQLSLSDTMIMDS